MNDPVLDLLNDGSKGPKVWYLNPEAAIKLRMQATGGSREEAAAWAEKHLERDLEGNLFVVLRAD